jgi:hypothetical protein
VNSEQPVPSGGWLDHAARLVTTVGFPVVAAGLLLWFVLSKFAADVTLIAGQMNANANAIEQLTVTQVAILDELRRQTADMHQQSVLMGQIAKDAGELVKLRGEELRVLQELRQLRQQGGKL